MFELLTCLTQTNPGPQSRITGAVNVRMKVFTQISSVTQGTWIMRRRQWLQWSHRFHRVSLNTFDYTGYSSCTGYTVSTRYTGSTGYTGYTVYTGFQIVLVTPAAPVAMAAPIAVLTRVTKQPGVQQAQTRVPQPAQPARQNYRKPVLPKVNNYH